MLRYGNKGDWTIRRCAATLGQGRLSAIIIDPDDARPHSNKGDSLHYLKRYDEAVECYDTAIRLDPDDARPHSNKGDALPEAVR